MAPHLPATQPEGRHHVGANEPFGPTLATDAANFASLPLAATVRQDPRQEPYEAIPHVRIRAGGVGQPASLPRQSRIYTRAN